jgi:hypothetical protein
MKVHFVILRFNDNNSVLVEMTSYCGMFHRNFTRDYFDRLPTP